MIKEMITKEEYIDYLNDEAEFFGEGYWVLRKLIDRYFELRKSIDEIIELGHRIANKPYKYKDLKVGMIVYDIKDKILIKVIAVYGNGVAYEMFGTDVINGIMFEENRFYPAISYLPIGEQRMSRKNTKQDYRDYRKHYSYKTDVSFKNTDIQNQILKLKIKLECSNEKDLMRR